MSATAAVAFDQSWSAQAPLPALQVLQVRPAGYAHSEALTELAEAVYFGLRRLRLRVFYRETPDCRVRPIVIGAHLLDGGQLEALPLDAIIYNSEQVEPGSPWTQGAYLQALTRRTVWDYSAENIRRLEALGARSVRHVPLGYVPELVRIAPLAEDVDVLFYGSINERRHKILAALIARGLNVVVLTGAYGEERDRAIARAKVVLSVHFYPGKIFEIVRAAYLLSNARAIVAECGPETSVEADLREALRGVRYDELVDTCVELVRDAPRRSALAERGQRIFARRREEDILADALGVPLAHRPAAPRGATPVTVPAPATLNLGSGRDFRPDCLNLDIDASSHPDAICDLASPGLIGSALDTTRFGRITLREESFEAAIAQELLEQIRDLPTAMTNVLRLLQPGGVLEALAPFDLGHGAWQHPANVRAFNERSWLCFTDRHWELGWLEARFDLLSLQLLMSPLGVELQRAGRSTEELLRTPRAVEGMRVRLRKRYLQESERREALRRQGAALARAPSPDPP